MLNPRILAHSGGEKDGKVFEYSRDSRLGADIKRLKLNTLTEMANCKSKN